MKKLISMIMILCLAAGFLSAGAKAEYRTPAEKYDFDFTLRLHADAFPAKLRARMEGYAELLEALRFRGTLIWAKDGSDFDLQLYIIPGNDEGAAIDLRVRGPHDYVKVDSSLLGDRTLALVNKSWVNFCNKMSEHLGLPLQYLALAYPYSWTLSLELALADWKNMVESEKDGVISAEAVHELWVYWYHRILLDEPTNILIEALSRCTEAEDAVRAVFTEAPDYFAKDFLGEKEIRIRRGETETTWENYRGEVFYREYNDGENSGSEVILPRMKTGYLPVFAVESNRENGWKSTWIRAGMFGQENQEDLLNLKMSLIAFPEVWPADCSSLVSLDFTGQMQPNLGISCFIAGEKNGHARVEIRKPTVDMEPGDIMLTAEGTLIPGEEEVEIIRDERNTEDEGVLGLLTSNDVEIQEFLPGILEPLAKGMLRFLPNIPTSACQTLMDDLTEIGVFSILMGE